MADEDRGSENPKPTLEDFDEFTRADAERWRAAVNWRWVDSVVWIATHDAALMKLIRAYRIYLSGTGNTESICHMTALEQISAEEWRVAERKLTTALQDGVIAATWLTGGAVVEPGYWTAPQVRGALINTFFPELPEVILPSARVIALWPADWDTDAGAPLPARTVGKPALRTWVTDQVNAGRSQRDLDRDRVDAFPGYLAPSREKVRALYNEIFEKKFGRAPASGAPPAEWAAHRIS